MVKERNYKKFPNIPQSSGKRADTFSLTDFALWAGRLCFGARREAKQSGFSEKNGDRPCAAALAIKFLNRSSRGRSEKSVLNGLVLVATDVQMSQQSNDF
jgi:hypothetical protein